MRRKQSLKGSLLPPELASAEQWDCGQGADPCPLSAHGVALLTSQSLLGHQYVRLFGEKF